MSDWPDDALIGLAPRSGEETLRLDDILQAIRENGETLALFFFGAEHWGTGPMVGHTANHGRRKSGRIHRGLGLCPRRRQSAHDTA
jgi:hypothetical protein